MLFLPLEHIAKRTELEQYLSENPQDAHLFAIDYFQKFLALGIKYQSLQHDIQSQSNSFPLEYDFAITKLKLYLDQYPEQASQLAIEHQYDFFHLLIKYRNLLSQKRNNHQSTKPQLPSFV